MDRRIALLFRQSAAFLPAIASGVLSAVMPTPGMAACALVPSPGSDVFVCDSGTFAGHLVDLSGNNTLSFPLGGSGRIAGNVTFGAGSDSVLMQSGEIAGQLQQGEGIDDFFMSGGVLLSLNQGGAFDTFHMTGGHIVGYFDDGDSVVMSGGRIGRVDLKLADNVVDMSGGAIDGNLVAGFGNDTIRLSGGTIGGNISVSGGRDSVTVTGGEVAGDVRLSFGNDRFVWSDNGKIGGMIDLGADDDSASLTNIARNTVADLKQLLGGPGRDDLRLNSIVADRMGRITGWETITAAGASSLGFAGNERLVLGDSATGTGSLSIDETSMIAGGGATGGVVAFDEDRRVTITNAGRIDLASGAGGAGDSFTIAGDYEGRDGRLLLDTVLGDDGSASDRLVFAGGGTASGTTVLSIFNDGGAGDQTLRDGIMVVETTDGATTEALAFSLGNRVVAGAAEYFLFRGGLSEGTGDNWYLRSTIVVPPDPTDPDPVPVPPDPDTVGPDRPVITPPSPTGPIIPPTPGARPVTDDVVTLYRVEVPAYAVVPPVAHHLALATLSTFHERRGDQDFVGPSAPEGSAAWGGVIGQRADLQLGGTATPGFDGTLAGYQLGLDVLGREAHAGATDRAGLFVASAQMHADVTGQAVGWENLTVGELDLAGTSVGAYWTRLFPDRAYVEAVVMGTRFLGSSNAQTGESIDIDGTGLTVSVEGGYPIALSEDWTFEPQTQLLWQRLSLADQSDSFSAVSFDTGNTLTARIGMRLHANEQEAGGRRLQTYLKANLWHSASADQTVLFGSDPIISDAGGTSLEIGGGIATNLNEALSLFAVIDHSRQLGEQAGSIVEGRVGLNLVW